MRPTTASDHLTLRSPCLLASAILLACASGFAASPEDNWPAWRGPKLNGVAPRGDPPVSWSETENVKWKVKTPGRGSATPIVWDDLVFIQTAVNAAAKAESASPSASPPPPPPQAEAQPPPGPPPGGGRRGGPGPGGMRSPKPAEPWQFVLLAVDRQTGKTRWQKVVREEIPHEGHHQSDGTFASCSPVTDGTMVCAFFGSRGLHAFDLAGNLKWSKDLGRLQIKNSFGEGASPALAGKTLVVTWDHEGDDFIAAFDKDTGDELWRQPRDEETSWATPLVVQHDGRTQVVTSATRKVRSYDLATGKPLWECSGMTQNVIPTPVADRGLIYAISGFRGAALLAIKAGSSGDLTGTDAIAWRHSKNTPYVPSPLLYDDRIYFFSGNNGVLSCFEAASGRALLDAEPIEALQGVYASPVAAAGRVYLVGRNGAAVVLKRADKLEVLASNRLEDRFDASPAIAGKELFLRGRDNLYCLARE